jgi:hypothetical protein
LGPLFSFDNLEFDFLTFLQGAKALTCDVAVMDEDVGLFVPGNKAITFGIAEPLDPAGYPHETSSSKILLVVGRSVAPQKNKGHDHKAFFPFRKGLRACLEPAYYINFIGLNTFVKQFVVRGFRGASILEDFVDKMISEAFYKILQYK